MWYVGPVQKKKKWGASRPKIIKIKTADQP